MPTFCLLVKNLFEVILNSLVLSSDFFFEFEQIYSNKTKKNRFQIYVTHGRKNYDVSNFFTVFVPENPISFSSRSGVWI